MSNLIVRSFNKVHLLKPKTVVWSVVGTFLVFISLNLHGYSISAWSKVLGINQGPFQIGSSRPIRSDDYIASLPVAFSQKKNDFNPVNKFISNGQDLSVATYTVPINHWTSLFRIEAWGYFIDPDLGMSWAWCLKAFGTFLITFLILWKSTEGGVLALILGSFFILFSPFFQFWSLFPAPYFAFSLTSVFLLSRAMESTTFLKSLPFSLLFIFTIFAFLLNLYPALQLIGVYFSVILFLFLNPLKLIFCRKNLLVILFSFLSAALLFLFYFLENFAIFETITNTVYPGSRFILGGSGLLLTFLKNNLLGPKALPTASLFGGNVCESASFINISPFLLVYLKDLKRFDKQWRILYFLVGIFLAVYLFWYFIGLPSLLVKITGLSLIPEGRSIFILSFLNLITLLYFIKYPFSISKNSVRLILIAWVLLHFSSGYEIYRFDDRLLLKMLLNFSSLTIALYLILTKRLNVGLALLVALTFSQTFSFNPIVKGGYKELFENSDLMSIKKVVNNDAVVINDDLVLGNLPRILGVKSFSGVHLYPQRDFWKVLDPHNKLFLIWNRYAHITWVFDPKFKERTVITPQGDLILIQTKPTDKVLKTLGVEYILTRKNNPIDSSQGVLNVLETSCCVLYRIL